jgi:hypothetical protein
MLLGALQDDFTFDFHSQLQLKIISHYFGIAMRSEPSMTCAHHVNSKMRLTSRVQWAEPHRGEVHASYRGLFTLSTAPHPHARHRISAETAVLCPCRCALALHACMQVRRQREAEMDEELEEDYDEEEEEGDEDGEGEGEGEGEEDDEVCDSARRRVARAAARARRRARDGARAHARFCPSLPFAEVGSDTVPWSRSPCDMAPAPGQALPCAAVTQT